MKAKILSPERVLVLSLFLIVSLDFLQPIIPIPVFAAIGVCAILLLFILYMDGILNSNESNSQSMAVLYTLFIALISFAIVFFEKDHKDLQKTGLIAANLPIIGNFQRMLTGTFVPVKTTNTEAESKSNPGVLKAINDPNYKAGNIKINKLKTVNLNYKILKLNSSAKKKSDAELESKKEIETAESKSDETKKEQATAEIVKSKSEETKKEQATTESKSVESVISENKDTQSQTKSKPLAIKSVSKTDQQSAKAALKEKDIKWESAEFYKAASKGKLDIVKLFLQSGMTPEVQLPHYKQSLIVALLQHNPEETVQTLKLFAEHGLDLNKKFEVFYAAPDKMTQKSQRTLLELAVMNLNTDVVKFLKEKGIKTDEVLKLIANDFAAAKIKSKKSRIQEMYHVLTGKEFAPSNTKDLNNKLVDALKISNVSLMEFYLLSGAKPDFKSEDNTPSYLLFKAARTIKAAQIVDLLVKHGANTDLQSSTGRTALFVHTQMNRYKAVKSLLTSKADPNIQAKDGSTAIYTASKENRIAILRLLIRAGAEVDTTLTNGKTPLMIASHNGHQDIVELLLKHGADTKLKDKKGLAPIDYAKVNGDQKIILMLNNKYKDLQDPW